MPSAKCSLEGCEHKQPCLSGLAAGHGDLQFNKGIAQWQCFVQTISFLRSYALTHAVEKTICEHTNVMHFCRGHAAMPAQYVQDIAHARLRQHEVLC